MQVRPSTAPLGTVDILPDLDPSSLGATINSRCLRLEILD